MDNKLINLEGLGIVYTELKNQISEYLTVEELTGLKPALTLIEASISQGTTPDRFYIYNNYNKPITVYMIYKGMVEPDLTESPLDTDIANIKTQYHLKVEDVPISQPLFTEVSLSGSLESGSLEPSIYNNFVANNYQGWFVYQAFADDGSCSELNKYYQSNPYGDY